VGVGWDFYDWVIYDWVIYDWDFYDWFGEDTCSVSEANRIEMKRRNIKGHSRDEKDKQR